MAWQLIYTSAPRLLEAGRSGFGTVARHRAISPLLVSAIERASQFSRLAGADAGRVIFSYRLISVAGGRFPVLSAIRDAGADYTGRTNHIAHHLIADPREVAQLGSNGPSPADVLLAMKWAASWSETPRHFEQGEEVALAAIAPRAAASAWARIAGNPNHARLLATGDASRGAYIIQPDGVDLRALFAESLRLMPDRLWQTSFTTSLQPSDEPADFRWIGIEERSPMRAQIETSGRPILNLASPDTLPKLETVAPQPVATASVSAAGETRTAAPAVKPAALKRSPNTVREPIANARPANASSSHRARWILVGTLALLLAAGFFLIKPLLERQKARNEAAAIFNQTGYFSPAASLSVASALVSGGSQHLANTSNSLLEKLVAGNLAELESAQTSGELELFENRGGAQLPEELGELRELIKRARQLARPPLEEANDAASLARIMDSRRDEISQLQFLKKPVPRLIEALHATADRQQAAALLAMLQQRLPPPEGGAFERAVESIASKMSDGQALALIKEIRQLLREKSSLPAIEPPSPLPKPPEVQRPALLSQIPLYFLNGKQSFSNFHFKELQPDSIYFLKLATDGKAAPLIDLNKNGILRRLVTGAADFEVSESKKEIALGSGSANLAPPFMLSARDSTGAELFEVWVCGAGPLFPPRSQGLSRKGDLIQIDPVALGFSGTPKNLLYLQLPVPAKTAALPVANWSVDLSALRDEIEAQTALWQQRRAELEKKLAEPPKDDHVRFAELAVELEKEARFNEVDRKRDFPPGNSSALLKCAGYLSAISRQVNSGGEPLFKAGEAIKALKPGAAPRAEGELIKVSLAAVEEAFRMLTTNEEKKTLGAPLKCLQQMLALLQPKTANSAAARTAALQEMKNALDTLNAKLSQAQPLSGKGVPPGSYRLFARDDGVDLPLLDIQVQ